MNVKVWITSLNSHFTHQEAQHKILKSKIAEPGTPHFLSLYQDIVAWSQDEKCGLKYDIHTSTSSVRTLDQNDTALAKKKAPTYQKKCVGEGLKGVRSIDS